MDSPVILAVDDMASNLAILKHILVREGFGVLLASDGPSARALAHTDRPDLILLDVMMPGEDGFETCARLKADRMTCDIPVIFLSALDDARSKVKGLKKGGVDYIAKPFDNEEVLARVRVHLRIREASRALVDEQKQKLRGLRDAQRAILVAPEDFPDAAFAVSYRPIEEAGGDFYDMVPVADGVYGYFIADVAGHNVGAAFLTATLKALLRQYAGPSYSPEETMRSMNAVMEATLAAEQFLTACYVRLNRRRSSISVVNAGHPPPILVSAAGGGRFVESEGDPLGMFGSITISRCDVGVARGDRLYLYTDGLIEDGRLAGTRRSGLAALLDRCVSARSQPLADVGRLVDDLRPPHEPQHDDLLLMGVDLLP